MVNRLTLLLLFYSVFSLSLYADGLKDSYNFEKTGQYTSAIEALASGKIPLDNEQLAIRIGWLHYLNKNYSDALVYYRKALRINRNNLNAALGIVSTYRAQGKLERALELSLELKDKYPKSIPVDFHLAYIHFAREDYTASIRSSIGYPKSAELLALSGWCYQKLGKLDLAEFKFRNALKYHPANLSALNGLAKINTTRKAIYIEQLDKSPRDLVVLRKLVAVLLSQGAYAQALPWQRKIASYDGKNIISLKKLGWLFFITGDYAKSIASYKAAVDIGGGVDSLVGIIKSLYLLKDWAGLDQVAQLILQHQPKNYYALHYLGWMHYYQQNYTMAADYFARFPYDAYSMMGLAQIHEKHGRKEQAKRLYKKSLLYVHNLKGSLMGLNRLQLSEVNRYLDAFKKNPKNILPLKEAITIFLANGKYQHVVHWCEKGLSYHPGSVFLRKTLTYQQYRAGEFRKALGNYQFLFNGNPKDTLAKRGILNCYLALKDYENARIPAEELHEAFPASQELRRLLSYILFEGGYYRAHEELARANPSDDSLNMTLGWNYFRQGKYSKSKAHFEEILEAQPQNYAARAALDVVEEYGQFGIGFFYTPINYSSVDQKKTVGTTMLTYAPNNWLNYRLLYNRTETEDNKTFLEDSYSVGISYRFLNRFNASVDVLRLDNNDSLSDNGTIACFQLGYQIDPKFKLTMEIDRSDFDKVSVTQYSPRVDWFPTSKWWIQGKGYFFDKDGVDAPGGRESAFAGSVTHFFANRFRLGVNAWAGKKRFSFESDKLFTFNSFDRYRGGIGFEFGYRAKRLLDYSFGYKSQRVDSFFRPGDRFTASQWTLGLKLRF